MAFSPRSAPCHPLLKSLNILPIPCVYILVVLLYVKANLKALMKNSDFDNHCTRNHDVLHHSYTRMKSASQGPKTVGLWFYNKLPTGIRGINFFIFENFEWSNFNTQNCINLAKNMHRICPNDPFPTCTVDTVCYHTYKTFYCNLFLW
jgi:hypothetical protein